MAIKKGQILNPTGRPKGSPNRSTTELKQWISELINNNREQFETDLQAVDPDKRLALLEKLFQYVVPKMQTITVEQQLQAEYAELEKLLHMAPDEAVEAIAQRILNLKNQTYETS